MHIQDILKNIGLSEKEIKVYLALLNNGKNTPAVLSKLTKINRATVYSTAKSLQAKGIIAEDPSGKTLYFMPLPPKQLEQLIERQQRELQEKENLVKKAIEELTLITASKSYPIPKIRFVEESQLEEFLFENTEKWQNSVIKNGGVWWGFQDDSLLIHYKKWVDWYWKTPLSKECKLQLFSNLTPVEEEINSKISEKLRTIRPSRGMNFTSSVWIGGDYLVMIVTRQHPFYLFEIHDPMLSYNMREVFKRMWEKNS